MLEINVAKSSGFCFGVRRAIDISDKLSRGKKKVRVLGDIVHNSFVVEELERKGIKKIRYIKKTSDSTLIISSHGAPKKIFAKARKCGYSIADATCPKVKDIYQIAKRLEKTNRIVIIGDSGHDEVKGIAGQLKKRPITLEKPSDVDPKKFTGVKKAAVITQSTQDIDNISKIMDRLHRILPKARLYNTTCRTTVIKQNEIRTLPKNNDMVLIIGSRTSANTKRLYQISRGMNPGTRWIESARDLRKSWFKKVKKVGIMAGASTPDHITKSVVDTIKVYK
ncbi:MAG: 4-hydroxy-3-methylbut-2-enyl diphosphate reductase [Candidatus Omnitrophota bacterium]|nr:4-hydroxy-3-methylbut-2-enyl diphosphate reductase [Candidatus Omnitrophota bacterium]